jgi:uncharacterized damage-inducible protein DinB
MCNPQDLVSRMQDFCGYLAGLGDVQAESLLAPMAEGKWSVQEVIAHIMTYDESFLQSVVLPIEEGRQPHFADEADNQAFNDRSAALGRNLTKAQLLERATLARRQLVDHLQRLPAEAFRKKQEGRADFDLAELIEGDFVSHDRGHVEQMQRYLKSRGYPDITYGAPLPPLGGGGD